MTTWTPHPRHPNATPPGDTPVLAGTVRADEDPLACITRSIRILADLHVLPTLTGARTSDLLQDIQQSAQQMSDELRVCGELLADAQEDLQAANDDQNGG